MEILGNYFYFFVCDFAVLLDQVQQKCCFVDFKISKFNWSFYFLTFTAKIFQNLIDPWNLTGLKVEANPSLSISISLFGILKHHNLIFIAKVFKTMLLPFSYVLFSCVRTVGLMFNRGICFLI